MSKLIKLSRKKEKEIFETFAKKYRFKIINSQNSALDEFAAALRCIGIRKPEEFLNSNAITINRRVWVPYKIGVGDYYTRAAQVANIAHESKHTSMSTDDKIDYIINPTKRAGAEHEPNAIQMECYHILTGKVLDPGALSFKLRHYRVSRANIKTAKIYLENRAERVEKGQYRSSQARLLQRLLGVR